MCNTTSCKSPAHFHPKGKPPSSYTVEAQKHQRQILPLADLRDFEEAKHGFIAAPDYRMIKNDKGGVAWDLVATISCYRAGTSTPSTRPCSARPS